MTGFKIIHKWQAIKKNLKSCLGAIFLITDKRSVSVLVCFSVTVINHPGQKQFGGGTSLHGSQFQVSVHH